MKLIQDTTKEIHNLDVTSTKPKILVVKGNLKTEDLLNINAKLYGFTVQVVEDGAAALLMASRVRPNLIVLDIASTKVRWMEFYRSIRKDTALEHTPILISTNSADAVCNFTDFGLGNTDFILDPFTSQELVLRMRRLLYTGQINDIETSTFNYGNLQFDVARYEVAVDGSQVHLTPCEFKLLTTLAQRQGRVQSRETLLQDVFSYNTSDVETRTIDTHMRRLRQKLGGAQQYLETVRGVGYRFQEKSIDQSRRWKLSAGRRHSLSRS